MIVYSELSYPSHSDDCSPVSFTLHFLCGHCYRFNSVHKQVLWEWLYVPKTILIHNPLNSEVVSSLTYMEPEKFPSFLP